MATAQRTRRRWTAKRAWKWYEAQPWIVGCNFIPSSAINQLEMWQEDTFDEETIERELGWAEQLGFNTVRVYLHDLLWQKKPKAFLGRVERFLDLCEAHGQRALLVLFDDCWCDEPALGKQPEPTPGVHNSGWARSPGSKVLANPRRWSRLERYVKGVLEAFGEDPRVLLWDVYNEPGNSQMHEKSLPLLKAAFEWAREAGPFQPLTAGLWYANTPLNEHQLKHSDVISFHNYNGLKDLRRQIRKLEELGRPLICTEYMRRPESVFATHLPVLRRAGIGAVNWGLVSGKTQTIYPWGSSPGAPPPDPWFHDVLHPDGTPYDPEEVNAIRKQIAAAKRKRARNAR